ncbi:MAG: hypothetical protein PHY80_05265 [Rickettsiales bacterium]|nr:hypothetical protein [Rickettsiales bacterium]
MKEIGGYFGLECANFSLDWLKDRILLNSGRNALRYIVRVCQIKKIAVPVYTCAFVWEALKAEGCELVFYHVDKNFMPMIDFAENDFVLYNNYFGVCGRQVGVLKNKYKNLIVDNTQALYSSQRGLGAFYSLRKFLGVPDGGLAWCDGCVKEELEVAVSYHLCVHLLKYYDKSVDAGCINFMKNECALDDAPIMRMSNLTGALLKNVDYEKSGQIRLKNFEILHGELEKTNELKLNLAEDDVPMVYPYLVKDELLRERLVKNKISLVPCWCGIDKYLSDDEKYLKKYLLPLPLDQRYDKNDMNRILEVLGK